MVLIIRDLYARRNQEKRQKGKQEGKADLQRFSVLKVRFFAGLEIYQGVLPNCFQFAYFCVAQTIVAILFQPCAFRGFGGKRRAWQVHAYAADIGRRSGTYERSFKLYRQ